MTNTRSTCTTIAVVALGLVWAWTGPVLATGRSGLPATVDARGVQQISRDTIHGIGLSEDATEVEPDVAVDPFNPSIVVASLAPGRNPDETSSVISFAGS